LSYHSDVSRTAVWKSPGKCVPMNATEKGRRWVIHRRLEGWKIQDMATALRTNEKTVYRWWSIYREHGWADLAVKSVELILKRLTDVTG
jgi:hypothetical protein